MATLKSKRKQMAEIENLKKKTESPVEEEVTTPSTTEDIPCADPSPYLNEAEQSVLAEQHEKDTEDLKRVSIAKMEKAVEVISGMFHLYGKGFSVNGFADKGAKSQLSMSNGDFDIVVTVKDSEKFGIV